MQGNERRSRPWKIGIFGGLFTLFLLWLPPILPARTIEWSGYQWNVRDSKGRPSGPGPNVFSSKSDQVWVDEKGYLHLKIGQAKDGTWLASQVSLTLSLTYGTSE